MKPSLTKECKDSFSPERLSTYLSACCGDVDKAMELYLWNMYVAGLFMPLLNLVEVILRNRISLVLEKMYGKEWAWNQHVKNMLPPLKSFNPRQELLDLISKQQDNNKLISKIIANSKFAFWQHLLTSRYQNIIWDSHIKLAFPYLDKNVDKDVHREALYQQIDQIRNLRNRIAHHEPIFNRNLIDDYQTIRNFLATCQSPDFLAWLDSHQTMSLILPRIMRSENFEKEKSCNTSSF